LAPILITFLRNVLELRLDETLLKRLDDDLLDGDLVAEDDLEACRLDQLLAAITGSQNNKSANRLQKTSKSKLFQRDFATFVADFCFLIFPINIIGLLSSAFTTLILFHLLSESPNKQTGPMLNHQT